MNIIDNKKNIPFSPPDISELEIGEVVEVLKSGWITTGPRTKLLERRLSAFIHEGRVGINSETEGIYEANDNRIVCLNSATAAEELNLRILGLGQGDEVIVPAYTYTATASAVIHCGATVRFVDIQKNGNRDTNMPEMDYDQLYELINKKTKAIVPVDVGGILCDYDKVFEIVESKRSLFTPMSSDGTKLGNLSNRIQSSIGRVTVVSDSAHSLGAKRIVNRCGSVSLSKPMWKNSGEIADFSSFSFHAVKNLTTGEGGASTWLPIEGVSNSELYDMFQLLSLHGQNKDALNKSKLGAWEYDIVGPWYKCNMTDIAAAIGLKQLDRYLDLISKRKRIVDEYDKACDDLKICHLNHQTECAMSSNHLYLIRIPGISEKERNHIISEMARYGVSTNVHYKPLPMMTAYKNMGWDIKDFPNSYEYYSNLISLPLHTGLKEDDVQYVCEVLNRVINNV